MTNSAVRRALRDRLTAAMRERDRDTAMVMRSAIAALENAEAVPVPADRGTAPGVGMASASRHVAGAVSGIRAAEAERLLLDEVTEAEILRREVASLMEAAQQYEDGGRNERAGQARAAARELASVVHSALGTTWG